MNFPHKWIQIHQFPAVISNHSPQIHFTNCQPTHKWTNFNWCLTFQANSIMIFPHPSATRTLIFNPFQSVQLKTYKLEMIFFLLFIILKKLFFVFSLNSLWAFEPNFLFFPAFYILFTHRINSAFSPSIFIPYQYCMNVEYKQGTFHNLNSIWLNDWLNKYSFDDASINLPGMFDEGTDSKGKGGEAKNIAIVGGNKIFLLAKSDFIPNTAK